MKNIFIDKLAYIYLKDKKVLTTLSKGKDTWYIPGGKREKGETDMQALKREIKEELSVDLVDESIKHYGIFESQAHGKPEGTVVRMTCYTGIFIGTLNSSAEVEKYDFFSYEGRLLSSQVDKLIYEDLYNKGLIT